MSFDYDLEQYYRILFILVQVHKYSLTEVEAWMPYEFGIYLSLLEEWIEKQEELRERQ